MQYDQLEFYAADKHNNINVYKLTFDFNIKYDEYCEDYDYEIIDFKITENKMRFIL